MLAAAAAAVGVVFLAQSQHTTKYERVNPKCQTLRQTHRLVLSNVIMKSIPF